MIAIINSVVVGVLAALVAGRLIDALWFSIVIGAVAFPLAVLAHQRHHARVWWGPQAGEGPQAGRR